MSLTVSAIFCRLMSDASTLLFETVFAGKPLFSKQLELVHALMNDPASVYYLDGSKREVYEKQQIRLKTLISQLLSPNVARNVPLEFESALRVVIKSRVGDDKLSDAIVKQVIDDLKSKNELGNQNSGKQLPTLERLKDDFKFASYVAIITGSPLEIESDGRSDVFSLRDLFVNEFLANLKEDQIPLKKYRLLLPLEPSCLLFWKGLRQITFRFIKQNKNESFVANLKKRYDATKQSQTDLFEGLTDNYINDLTNYLLHFLNAEGFLVVFCHNSPLFNLPLIAINPAEFRNSKIYALFDSERSVPLIHKYSSEETVMWRFFVWDRIKTKEYSGKRVDFKDSLNRIIEY